MLTNFEGGTYRYPDPCGNTGKAQDALSTSGYGLDPAGGLYRK
jgi:hypothetical protein